MCYRTVHLIVLPRVPDCDLPDNEITFTAGNPVTISFARPRNPHHTPVIVIKRINGFVSKQTSQKHGTQLPTKHFELLFMPFRDTAVVCNFFFRCIKLGKHSAFIWYSSSRGGGGTPFPVNDQPLDTRQYVTDIHVR